MSSVRDATSTVFPIGSHSQAMSGMSTVNIQSLPAEMDELSAFQAPKSGVSGPRQMDFGRKPRLGVYDTFVRGHSTGRMDNADYEHPGQRGPYSSIGRALNPGHASVQRGQSAKQLIHRFESITSQVATVLTERPPGSAQAAAGINSRGMYSPFLTIAPHKSKRRSLSTSLRNFMSVFKKKKDQDDDNEEYISPRHTPEYDDITASQELLALSQSRIISGPPDRDMALSWSKANAQLSNSLLYFSRPSSLASSLLPIWISCTVTLYDSHLLITWYTVHGNPSSHIIPLSGCTDVHSLALKHMDPDERVLLPGSGGDLKTFELLFEGRPREKFATTSSQDRARWVSAIWDAVLSSQEKSEAAPTHGPGKTLIVRTDVSSTYKELHDQCLQPPSVSEYTGSEDISPTLETATVLTKPHCTSPPTPVAKSPRHTLSPMTLSPPHPPSQLSTASRPKTPSIANLGTLSVVTQRLAQMESSELASPTPTAITSSSVGTALQRAQDARSTRVRRAFAEIEKLQEESGGGTLSRFVVTPSTDTSTPLPNPPTTPLSEAASVRSRSVFGRRHLGHNLPPAQTPTRAPTPAPAPAPALHSKLSEPAIREHAKNPPVSILAVGVEPHLAPLVELIKDSAAKHYDQTAGLGEQIIALQRDIHNLPKDLQPVIGQIVTAAKQTPVPGHPDNVAVNLQDILARVEEIRKHTSGGSAEAQVKSVLMMVEGLQTQFGSHIPRVMEILASIEQGQTQLQLHAAREVGKPPPSPTCSGATKILEPLPLPLSPQPLSPVEKGSRQGSHQSSVNLSDIYSKLDDLVSLHRSGSTLIPAASPIVKESHDIPRQSSHADSEKLQTILDYLQTGEEQRKLQLEQQTDSVRYLNELNSWLDAFVNNGTVHIQSVAANVEQLCALLGLSLESETADGQPSSHGILSEIKHLISSIQSKAQGEDLLQVSIGDLMGAVQEHMKNGDERRDALVTDSVLEIVNRHRHEQEQMLRALSSELTNEIRGERLRFVEAMKEATAINVQAHVEHFKEELGREVAAMTQDVGRLHQEKQVIEQQIADLFAFYSKQKQDAENNARRNVSTNSVGGFNNLQNLPASTSKQTRRPLPHPVFKRGN
ncbi:hypothetical protein PAXRUDRAFT_14144 [Paxillus rubicundulus Ve08.2h10]|uniref:PH domain-containing protein n=1 Tax=Paxillus rubicundulus Ve08.2h10 TaxID=930991 RepID=A0A0D0E213_9AGAM|nr:hypothetical protein PAXRUDRAFT_14144 [Paxillus rubicundulus Ve08.2h10]